MKTIFFCFFISVLSACGSLPGKATQEPVTLKVQLIPYMSNAPLYFAQEEGYFQEQGLNVEFLQLQGGAAFVSLIQGEIDVAASFLSSTILSAVQKGETVKVVADKGYIAPEGCVVNGLLARSSLVESGELNDVEDLVGRKVKYDKASVQAYFLDTLLHAADFSLADVEQVDFNSPPILLDAFSTGAVDVAAESEPWITRNLNTGNSVLWKDFKDLIPDFQFAYLIYGPTLLEKNQDAGRRFMVAYLKAVRQYNEGKTERNIQLMETFTGLDKTMLGQICWPTFRQDLLINTQSVLDFQEWAIQNGLLESAAQIEEVWNPSFAEYALSQAK